MKTHKINKKLLYGGFFRGKKAKELNTGYKISNVYSDDFNTDDIGRWARKVIYNGLLIAWISGYTTENEKLGARKSGKVKKYSVSLFFPISISQANGHLFFENYEDALRYVKQMFTSFRKHIEPAKKPKTYNADDMIKMAKYGYDFHKTTSFPEMDFEEAAINNAKQYLQSF